MRIVKILAKRNSRSSDIDVTAVGIKKLKKAVSVNISLSNTLVGVIFGIDVVIMLALYYLYSNKKKDVFVSLALIEYIILSKYEISFMNRMKEISKAVNYKKTNRQKNYNYYNAIDSSFRSEQSSSYLTKH